MPKAVPYKKGSIIFFAGDKDDRIFILQKGNITLTGEDLQTGAQIVENLHEGEFFGVKSALSHMPRIETANVQSDAVVVLLTPQEFEKIFGRNPAVIGKMLHVFSKNLRDLHKRTEELLKSEEHFVSPEEGMIRVAKSFEQAEEYRSACSVCNLILSRFHEGERKAEVEKLLASYTEKAKAEPPYVEPEQESSDAEEKSEPRAADAATLKQFSLPVFERFTKSFEPGQVITSEFEPGDTFYLIKSGDVQIVKDMNGTKKNMDILHAGEFFGEMAILDNSPRSATCMARGKVECLEFNKENFQALVLGNSTIAINLLKLFCKRIYDSRRGIRILTIKDIQARVADVFVMFDEVTPHKDDPDGDPMDSHRRFNLTVADVAQWTGISQDDARDELNKYVSKKKLEIYDAYMNVTNINDMKRTVEKYFSNLEQ